MKDFSDKRKERARHLLQEVKPQELDECTYLVPSQNNPEKKYYVTHIDAYSCECPDFQRRCKGNGLYCKHIQAILLLDKLKTSVQTQPIVTQLTNDVRTAEVCPYCYGLEIFKRGKRKTTAGEKQLYCCKDCKKRFVLESIKYIKSNAQMVTLAMDLFYKGNSLRDIADTFKQFYDLSLSHETIRNWIRKFTRTMNEYSKQLKPKTSGIWNADETLVLTKKGTSKNKRNTGHEYVWNVIDNETKFLLASVHSGRKRGSKEAQKVMTEAYKQSGKIPYQIITDKLPSYQDGIRKTFRNWGNERKVKHTSIVGRRKEIDNNAVESHHSQQKEFQKVRRGINEIQDYSDGFKIFHNFVRKGVKDNRTPAERCGIGVKSLNRWEGLLLSSLENDRRN